MNTTPAETRSIVIGSATLILALAMLVTAALVNSRDIFWLAVIPTTVGLYYLTEGIRDRTYRIRDERRIYEAAAFRERFRRAAQSEPTDS